MNLTKIINSFNKSAIVVGCAFSSLLMINASVFPTWAFVIMFILMFSLSLKFNLPKEKKNDNSHLSNDSLITIMLAIIAFFIAVFALKMNLIYSFMVLFGLLVIAVNLIEDQDFKEIKAQTSEEKTLFKFKKVGGAIGLINAVFASGILAATGALKGINGFLKSLKARISLDTNLSSLSTISTIIMLLMFVAGISTSANMTKKSIEGVFEGLGRKYLAIKKEWGKSSIFTLRKPKDHQISLSQVVLGVVVSGAVLSSLIVSVIGGFGSTLAASPELAAFKNPLLVVTGILTAIAVGSILSFNVWKKLQNFTYNWKSIARGAFAAVVYSTASIKFNISNSELAIRIIGGISAALCWFVIFGLIEVKPSEGVRKLSSEEYVKLPLKETLKEELSSEKVDVSEWSLPKVHVCT